MVDKNAGLTRISYLTCRVKEVQNRNVHVKMLNGLKKERLKFAATYWVVGTLCWSAGHRRDNNQH